MVLTIKRYFLFALLVFAVLFAANGGLRAQNASASSPLREARIAVVLPFKAQLSEGERSLEFYRGLLLAADHLKPKGYNVHFSAFDEGGPESDVLPLLNQAAGAADLMIGFSYRDHALAAGQFCAEREMPVLFPLTTYIPQVLTANPYACFLIPEVDVMSQKTCALLSGSLGKSNVIYLQSASPQTAAQTRELQTSLQKKGCKAKILDAAAPTAQWEKAFSAKRHNLVVTDTNDPAVLRPFLTNLKLFATKHPGFSISVVGTAKWMEHIEGLQDAYAGLSLYIPTTWYFNGAAAATQSLLESYQQWFYKAPSGLQPSAFLMGYDFGLYAIAGLSQFGRAFIHHRNDMEQHLLNLQFQQSTTTQCWTNGGIRLLHIKPDNSQEFISFQ